MKCPYCSAALDNDALNCSSCHAMRIVQRSPLGVVTGWLGIVLGVQVVLVWILMLLVLLSGLATQTIPWQLVVTMIAATFVTGGLLWHSRSTKRLEWRPPSDTA